MSNEMIIGIFECTLANRQYNGASQSSMRDVTTKISRQRSKCSKIMMTVKKSDMRCAFKVTLMNDMIK